MVRLGPYIRFRHPKLIDSIPDRLESLISGEFHQVRCRGRIQDQLEGHSLFAGSARLQLEIGVVVLDEILEHFLVFPSHEDEFDPFQTVSLDFDVFELVLTKVLSQVIHDPLEMGFHGFPGFHFQDKVNPALEVKAEVNPFLRKKRGPPGRQFLAQGWDQENERDDEKYCCDSSTPA
jgi:hypothetical protein